MVQILDKFMIVLQPRCSLINMCVCVCTRQRAKLKHIKLWPHFTLCSSCVVYFYFILFFLWKALKCIWCILAGPITYFDGHNFHICWISHSILPFSHLFRFCSLFFSFISLHKLHGLKFHELCTIISMCFCCIKSIWEQLKPIRTANRKYGIYYYFFVRITQKIKKYR